MHISSLHECNEQLFERQYKLKSKQFKNVDLTKEKLDKSLEIAQIQKLYSSAAKDRQEVSESIQKSFGQVKKNSAP